MIAQKNPLIKAIVNTVPDIPKIGEIIPEAPTKLLIISAGGNTGIIIVTPKMPRKEIKKIDKPNILLFNYSKINLFLV